ncbi:SpoIIE family protein phosphatase [Solirubrobacter sp. CPCC 204708]|uniref:SpoIIE family protein phosphatase n=1 Tax=Solirubrobacter deserti TaxID=2282478 RepID=A0ABT4RR02_9ACTN|nr:SpoIIE family protein phosphatase [Solirubrobacter deserti]MBE2320060.1 SpoIIE family protein phosphatase [Solirubrobacter deserti]MDA0141000.1 SpoIIE family protein phosphatase [Solirubrobacter deserti]
MEPTLTAVVDVEPLLDVMPVPLVALEPVTGRVLHVNAAAGGEYPREPALRVAGGESLSNVQFDWDTGARLRTVLVSGTMVTLAGSRQVALLSFEDVTELETGRRRASVQADELEVMLDGIADAVTVQSPDFKLVYANRAATRLYDIPHGSDLAAFSTEEYLRDYDVVDEAGHPLDLARMPGRLALSGLDPEPVTIRSVDRRTGVVQWARIKATAVRDPDGGVRLAINVIEDITELKRSEEAQRFLAEASRRLASASLDYELTLTAVAEMAVPELADTCSVVLADAESAPADVLEVLATGVAALAATRVVVPMLTGGRVLGAITVERAMPYDAQDVLVVEDFALRAGAAVENARLYRAASEIARALQTSLLPPVLPEIPGAQLAAAYLPAGQGLEVGGDFYDVFSTGDGHWFLVIGDVCGKGAEAAALTALARYTLRSAAARLRSPAAILRWVDEAMRAQAGTGGRFCTIACVHVDLAAGVGTVACGGHPLPVVRRSDGRVELFGEPGTLLGLLPDLELPETSTQLRPGDALVLYTDGLTEARAPLHTWDEEELLAAVRSAPMNGPVGVVDSLVAGALGDRAAPRDDLAVLVLKLS